MALATAEDVRQYLNRSIGDDGEMVLDMYLDGVQQLFETECKRAFDSATYTDHYLDAPGTDRIFPAQYPVTAISSIYQDSSRGWDATSLIDSADYFIDSDERGIILKSGTFIESPKAIKITYTAGYTTIPNDLKMICIIETARLFRKDYVNQDLGVKSRNEEGLVTSFLTDTFLPGTKRVLKRYTARMIF